MYTANSGGITADAGAVFDLYKPYLIARSDPASLKGKMARGGKEIYCKADPECLVKNRS